MSFFSKAARLGALSSIFLLMQGLVFAQTNAGSINGTVTDPSGAVIVGAKVDLLNPVSAYSRNTVSDASGHFQFTNLPFNSYHVTATVAGFALV